MIGAVLLGFISAYAFRSAINRRLPIWLGAVVLVIAYVAFFILGAIINGGGAGDQATNSISSVWFAMAAAYTVCMKDEKFSKAKEKKLVFWALGAYVLVFLLAFFLAQNLGS
ncbi:hypothetical protein N9N58_04330 [Alphaproteobacteria bacterium]|nr:hypothetical protein [Alphaproteobacteria bacterium]